MESSFVFVQQQPFQFISSFKAMSKRTQEEERVTAKSKPMMNFVSRYRVRDPNVLASTASESPGKAKSESQNVPLSSVHVQQTSTGRPGLDASSFRQLRMEHWWKVVFSRVEIWWNFGSKNGETRGRTTVHPAHRQVCHRWRWYGLWHRHRIEPVEEVTVILAQGEWSIAKDIGPVFKRCNARHRRTFFNLGSVYVVNIGSICIHGKELQRTFAFHQKYMEQSHSEHSNQLGKFSMETIISGQWWRSHQSLAREDLLIFRFYVMPWKDEREPNIKYCLGTAVGLVQRFITIQNFGHKWRRTDGIRVEYFPVFTTLQLVQDVQQLMNRMGKPEQFQGRIIFMSMSNDIIWWIKDTEKECIANSTLVSLFAKRFPAGHWSFFGPGSEKKWYSTYNDRQQGEWDKVAEVMMIKFGESGHPVFRATSPMSRGTLKSKGGGKLSFHFCADGDTIETVFEQLFLLISSVSAEQSQICVRNTVLVKQVRGDPYWQSNLSHCSRQQTYW